MQLSLINKSNTLILPLDAEKAFDRLNWKFLFESFINWIKALYITPTVMCWFHQASLSTMILYLFPLFIEPLGAAVAKYQRHTTILYVDDLLLLMQDSHSFIPESFTVIDAFSKVSNYYMNWSNLALPLCIDEQDVGPLVSSLLQH